jgi:hypothetical protein
MNNPSSAHPRLPAGLAKYLRHHAPYSSRKIRIASVSKKTSFQDRCMRFDTAVLKV